MPCNPLDIYIPPPPKPISIGLNIKPFVLDLGILNPFPPGFPEDLLGIFKALEMLIPSGSFKPTLSVNIGRDIFDAIIKLMDQFLPYLMLYKFFLPILNIIICVIEVLCAITNPFKLPGAISRLFRNCIPAFLNLFPLFALIIMIISLLLLLLALIEYLLSQILRIILLLLRNIQGLARTFEKSNTEGALAIAKKIGVVLCGLQNLFVLLSLFSIIIQIIREILSLSFSIPPCDDSGGSGLSENERCCTPDVCPAIVKNGNYTRKTGVLQYLREVGFQTTQKLPDGNFLTSSLRQEAWEIVDLSQQQAEKFINIVDAYDVTTKPKPVFFPTDSNYSATTTVQQAAYTIDLRVFYNPVNWSRAGTARWIRFTNCVVLKAPTTTFIKSDNTYEKWANGILLLAGGLGYEDDGVTVLTGFDDNNSPISDQATLENFLHMPANFISGTIEPTNVYSSSDGYEFYNVEYTFKPNMNVLFSKDIITLGCFTSVEDEKTFINTTFANAAAVNLAQLGGIVNSPNFPNPAQTQNEIAAAVSALQANLTPAGLVDFQNAVTASLNNLKNNTNTSLLATIGLGVDPCISTISLSQNKQFTTKDITISVTLNERNGQNVCTNLPMDAGQQVAADLKAYPTLGSASNFAYDGYGVFNSTLTSDFEGAGSVMVSFNNQTLCTNTLPADMSIPSTHTLQQADYNFVYSPSIGGEAEVPLSPVVVPSVVNELLKGDTDTTGQPQRTDIDVSNLDSNDDEGGGGDS